MSYSDRKKIYKALEDERKSKLIVYITGDRQHWATHIHREVLNLFIHHLDVLKKVPKISLYLYTRGGKTLDAWSLVNLIKQFCVDLEVIVPSNAHSAGTLICLGANNIVMTKQATLSSIDPSVNTPLNPPVPGIPNIPGTPNKTLSVNVESIKGYIEFVKEEFGVKKSADLANVINSLTSKIHPLVLGEVYRTRTQIKMLARKLLDEHISNKRSRNKIIKFLCSESGSHDYTINRDEAKNSLNLPIEKPDDKQYKLIKDIFDDIENELLLATNWDPNAMLGDKQEVNFTNKRALIESITSGSHYFVTEGNLFKMTQNNQEIISEKRIFEGWKYEQ